METTLNGSEQGLLAVMVGVDLDLEAGARFFGLEDLHDGARKRALEQVLSAYGGVDQAPYLQRLSWLAMARVDGPGNGRGRPSLMYVEADETCILDRLDETMRQRRTVFWNRRERNLCLNRALVSGHGVGARIPAIDLLAPHLGLDTGGQDGHRGLLAGLMGIGNSEDPVTQRLIQAAAMGCLQMRMQDSGRRDDSCRRVDWSEVLKQAGREGGDDRPVTALPPSR